MATHSSVLAWRIPGKAEPGGLLSMWSHKGEHSPRAGDPVPEQRAPGKCSVPRPGHSSFLAWRIPGKAEPGGLQSMGLHRVGHN